MADLKNIKGLGERNLELLEAVGIDDLEGLAESTLPNLYSEIEKANEELDLVKKIPTQKLVEKWVLEARDLSGVSDALEEEQAKPSPEEVAEILTVEVGDYDDPEENSGPRDYLVNDLPQAQTIPGKALVKAGLKVNDIPIALVIPEEKLNKVLTQKYAQKQQALLTDSKYVASLLNEQKKEKRQEEGELVTFDRSKIQSIEEVNQGAERRVQPLVKKENSIVTSVSKGLNKGVSSDSRRYIRGVLHFMPERITRGALLVLAVPFVILAGLGSIILSVTPLVPEGYKLYAIGGFVLTPLICIVMFMIASGGKCQVCGQRQFLPKQTRKNKGAHYIPGLGHIIPTALHALLFRWFRCIYCATSIRLKE